MSKSNVNCHVFVDFDGTIVPGDATDMLFERYADPSWLDIEADWKAGRIGSRECMARQVSLLRASPEEFDAFVRTVEIDPAFPEFVDLCRSRGIKVTVVSDGFDRTIAAVLDRAGLDIPYFANRLEWLGDGWRLGFPNGRTDCRAQSGNCKCQFSVNAREDLHVMIGDGRSDFCIAGRVDKVFAIGALAKHCREQDLPHQPVKGFSEICHRFVHWLESDVARKSERVIQRESVAK